MVISFGLVLILIVINGKMGKIILKLRRLMKMIVKRMIIYGVLLGRVLFCEC